MTPTNAFIGKLERPTAEELAVELGPALALWDQLLEDLARELDIVTPEWGSYSPKAGWSLRLKRGERAILYMSPCRGCFRVSFALGDKAVRAARQAKLPKPVIDIINQAKRYTEGTGVRLIVTGPKDIAAVRKLAAIKLEN
jgi:hypothetical protein